MATIEEAAALFRLETTELFREYLRMFAKDLLDAASLYTLAMPTEQHPRHYIGVKWTCVESPSSLIKNRDWCYLEVPTYIPSRSRYLQVIHAIQVDFRGNVPSWVVKFGMKRRARSIGEIDHHLREKRLGGEKFLADHDLVPKLARSKCFLCHKKHATFTKKHNCRRFCAREVVVMSKFPVPQDFIYCPPLGKDERANLVNLGENSLIDLVRSSKLHSGAIKWTMDSDENGIQIFHGEDPNGPTEVTLLAGVTEVLATFDEIAALFRQETKEAYAEYTKLFAKDTLDSAHLYTISTATPDRPRHFMGVRWVVIGSPYPLLANRDLCYLECQDDFEINGKRGWGRSMTSISLPCCPDFEGHLGTIRATFIRSGFVVHESKRPGYLQVIHALQIDLKGRVPQWVVKIGMKKRARSIGDFDKYLREKRLSAKPYLRDQDLVPKSSRFKCFLCQSKFGTFSTKVRCRKCGEVVCGKCNKFWQVKTTNAGRKMIRVCSACSITGGGHDGYPKDGVASSVAVSGVASSSEYSGIVVFYPTFGLSADGFANLSFDS
ncbi:hypothetical protein DYB28_006354 [Aphanomyces astaci]|uniref:FYVE-type domain-containing protein n=1 Tax=Aphanomyces astaci TaxID=112090 RepID=A0A9X8DX28_APHAT|nr:hypothetical protein DYB28_006354 [Aphanomyces astaci]